MFYGRLEYMLTIIIIIISLIKIPSNSKHFERIIFFLQVKVRLLFHLVRSMMTDGISWKSQETDEELE